MHLHSARVCERLVFDDGPSDRDSPCLMLDEDFNSGQSWVIPLQRRTGGGVGAAETRRPQDTCPGQGDNQLEDEIQGLLLQSPASSHVLG